MNRWDDGTFKSNGNGFTHGFLGEPHGYVIGARTQSKEVRRKGRVDALGPGLNPIQPNIVTTYLRAQGVDHDLRARRKRKAAA
jgi:hypothetical protein